MEYTLSAYCIMHGKLTVLLFGAFDPMLSLCRSLYYLFCALVLYMYNVKSIIALHHDYLLFGRSFSHFLDFLLDGVHVVFHFVP